MNTEIPTLSLNEWAEADNTHPRTVKRWLANGEIPGAYKDAFTGEWRIPQDASRQRRPLNAEDASAVAAAGGPSDILFGEHPGAGQGLPWWASPELLAGQLALAGPAQDAAPTRLEMLDEESAFLTIERAARFLGVPQAQIRANPETFGLMPVGINGSLMVPKSTIRQFEGQ